MSSRALIVGINEYALSPLRGCVNDALAMANHLVELQDFNPLDITLLCDGRATKSAIVAEVRNLTAGARKGDRVFFHYSGHGALQVAGATDGAESDGVDECLCPVDYDWTRATALVDDELAALFDDAENAGALITMTIDACHSGGLMRALKKDPGDLARTLTPPPDVAWMLSQRPRRRAPRANQRTGTKRGGGGRVLLEACQSSESAWDAVIDGTPCGAFTHFLLEALRAPDETVQATMKKTARALRDARYDQNPMLEGVGELEQVPFLGQGEAPRGSRGRRALDAVPPSGAVVSGNGYSFRVDWEDGGPGRVDIVLRSAGNITWWKSIEAFGRNQGGQRSSEMKIATHDNVHEAEGSLMLYQVPQIIELEFWKAGFLNSGAYITTLELDADRAEGKRLIFTWLQD